MLTTMLLGVVFVTLASAQPACERSCGRRDQYPSPAHFVLCLRQRTLDCKQQRLNGVKATDGRQSQLPPPPPATTRSGTQAPTRTLATLAPSVPRRQQLQPDEYLMQCCRDDPRIPAGCYRYCTGYGGVNKDVVRSMRLP